MCGGAVVSGQAVDRAVPGDDFSLEGALELFKKSASPEEFERILNAENSKVNNLDLNGDGNQDLIGGLAGSYNCYVRLGTGTGAFIVTPNINTFGKTCV